MGIRLLFMILSLQMIILASIHFHMTEVFGFMTLIKPGRHVINLYADPSHPESIHLTRLGAGTRIPSHEHPGGNEIFVLEGSIEDEFGRYEVGDWIRSPAGSVHQPWTDDGCILYVKERHLPR